MGVRLLTTYSPLARVCGGRPLAAMFLLALAAILALYVMVAEVATSVFCCAQG
ncbi:MAG TPA: hypothetical protein VGS41_16100 [Chthonomonadales bacterium]|nr:hypothetical protein [Chthonomonadales bacterium]